MHTKTPDVPSQTSNLISASPVPSQGPTSSSPWQFDAATIAARRAARAAVPARRYSLRDVIDSYMVQYSGRDPGRASVLRMWQATLGDRMIDEIDVDDVAEVLDALAEQPVMRYAGKDRTTGEPIYRVHGARAPATINRAKIVLGAIFKFAKAERLLPRGHMPPTKSIAGLPTGPLPDRSLSADQVGALLAYAKTARWPRMYLFTLMALTTGARRGELLQLRGIDLDLDATVATATARATKNDELKTMPLTPAVVAEIRRLGVPLPMKHLFPSERRENQAFEVAKSFKLLLKRAGLTHARLHDMRHTVGATLAREGRSDSEIAAVLGHKTLQVVKRYASVNPAAKANIVGNSALSRLR